MKRPPQVIVVGTLNVDYIWQVPVLPQPGQTIIADAAERQFGGKGANQAVAVARQGFPVTLVGAVGNDADGQRYREHLLHEGVAAEFVTSVAGAATGAAHVYVDPRGENLIVVNRGANAQLDATVVARVVQPGDVMLLQLECALPAAVAALRFAALQGARSVLNASPVNRNFPWGRQAIEAVVVNQHECREIFAQEPLRLERLSYVERGALLAERAAAVFAQDPLVISAAGSYLRTVALCFPLMAVEAVYEGALTGMQRTLWVLAVGIVFNLGRIPLALWLVPRWGVEGVWMAIAISTGFKAPIKWLCFRLARPKVEML